MTEDSNLAGGFTCGAIENGKACGEELYRGKTYSPARIPLCEKHAATLYTWNVGLHRVELVEQLEKESAPLVHLPGYVYIVALPNGRIKIGTSKTWGGLTSRWRDISRTYRAKGHTEPVKPLSIISGGLTREALLHGRFSEFRVRDEFGEQFRAEPELVAYAEMYGLPEGGEGLCRRLEKWWAGLIEKEGRRDAKREAETLLALEKEEEARKAEEDPWYFPPIEWERS